MDPGQPAGGVRPGAVSRASHASVRCSEISRHQFPVCLALRAIGTTRPRRFLHHTGEPAEPPRTTPARVGRPACRGRTGLGRPGATITRVRLRSGSAVVAVSRLLPSSAPAADAPPPVPRLRPTTPQARAAPSETRSPPSDGDLIPVRPRRLPRGACHAPPGGATFRLDPAARAARAVGFPIPSPSPAGAGRLRAGRRGLPGRSVCRHGHRDARRIRDFRDLRPLGGLRRRPRPSRFRMIGQWPT